MIPSELESSVVLLIGVYAKYLTVIGAAIVLAALYGLYGVLFTRLEEGGKAGGRIGKGLIFSLPPWLLHSVSAIAFG